MRARPVVLREKGLASPLSFLIQLVETALSASGYLHPDLDFSSHMGLSEVVRGWVRTLLRFHKKYNKCAVTARPDRLYFPESS